jgi:hypothetical protein
MQLERARSAAEARYEYDIRMIYEDTLRFGGYALGALFLESVMTKTAKWQEKGMMVLAGALGSAIYHLVVKQSLSQLPLYPVTPPHMQTRALATALKER